MRKHARLPLAVLLAVALWLSASAARGGLIAYYSFDDGTADDGSGNGNDGTVGSNLFFTGSDVPFGDGQAAGTGTGGGSTRVITVPTSPTLEGINHTLTVSFWMKATTGDNDNWVRIFQHGTEGNPSQTWLIDRYTNTTRTNMRVDTMGTGGQFNQNIATGGSATFDDTWHHLVYSIDTGTFAKYTDKSVNSGTYKHGQGLANTRPLYIFGRNGGGQYVGLLDDIAIWDSALTQTEAHAIYNLAMTPRLAYGAADAEALFDLFAAGWGGAYVQDDFWINAAGLPGSPGDVVPMSGGRQALVLDSAGNGVIMVIPEPSTFVLFALGLLGVRWVRRGNRR